MYDASISPQGYVSEFQGFVFIRQHRADGRTHEIVLQRDEAFKLADWLSTYCLQEFAVKQGTGE